MAGRSGAEVRKDKSVEQNGTLQRSILMMVNEQQSGTTSSLLQLCFWSLFNWKRERRGGHQEADDGG